VEIIQEVRQVAGKLLHAIRPRQCTAASVPAQIGHNQAMLRCQCRQDRLIHRAADHQTMNQQEWRADPRLLDEQR